VGKRGEYQTKDVKKEKKKNPEGGRWGGGEKIRPQKKKKKLQRRIEDIVEMTKDVERHFLAKGAGGAETSGER